MTKKAALGGPSSDETFPLREKTKFYCWQQLATRWYDIYDQSSVALALQAIASSSPMPAPRALNLHIHDRSSVPLHALAMYKLVIASSPRPT